MRISNLSNTLPLIHPIIFVEDDVDDQNIFSDALKQLDIPNQHKFFSNGEEALEYLDTTSEQPFVIFCDVNMPKLNGIELRNRINESDYLRRKSIPFIFFTTASNQNLVNEAFDLSVQGFFKKPNDFADVKSIIKKVLDYWYSSKHPNRLK